MLPSLSRRLLLLERLAILNRKSFPSRWVADLISTGLLLILLLSLRSPQTQIVDPKTDESTTVLVDEDDGIRDAVTPESLSKLKPAFSKDGSTHAGS